MPPTNSCPRCGRPSPSGNTFCAGCGSTLSATSSFSGKGWKLFFGAFALFVGLLWAAAIYTRTQHDPQLAGTTAQSQTLLTQSSTANAPQLAQAEPSPKLTLTSAQHLSEAKRALADGYKPNKDAQKTQWGEVAAAKWHLKAIITSAPEHREAQELLKEVTRRERQIELARKQADEGKNEGTDATAEANAAADDAYSSESTSARSTISSPTHTSPSSSTPARTSPPAITTGGGGGSSSDYYTNSRGVQVRRPTFSESGPPAGATAQCGDGSYSFSQSRRGTCSHHGGVARWL
jgi:hypothetical protein